MQVLDLDEVLDYILHEKYKNILFSKKISKIYDFLINFKLDFMTICSL
jgi:hypothetical protein